MIAHLTISPGTTVCADTPSNWRNFEIKKAAIQSGTSLAHKPTTGEQFNQLLQRKISRENKRLRSLRMYLPGHAPDYP